MRVEVSSSSHYFSWHCSCCRHLIQSRRVLVGVLFLL